VRSIVATLTTAAALGTAGPATAAAPLLVTFDHPAPGATVCGAVAVGQTLVGGSGRRSLTFEVDGRAVSTIDAGPGPRRVQPSQAWDTPGVADGPHRLTVSVTDEAGAAASASLTLDVANHAVVTITSPPDGATVHGAVEVRVVGAACGIRDFRLDVDAAAVAMLAGTAGSTAIFTWDSTGAADGAHTLRAAVTGRGIGGDMTAMTTIRVNVRNAGGVR
jgi:Big-like domain-containing protein